MWKTCVGAAILTVFAGAQAFAQTPRQQAVNLVGATCSAGAVGDESPEFRDKPDENVKIARRVPGPIKLAVTRTAQDRNGYTWVYVLNTRNGQVLGWIGSAEMTCNTDSQASCDVDRGRSAAVTLVEQCNDISGEPSMCNSRLPCRSIVQEVARKCREWRATPNAQDDPPNFCRLY